MGLSSRTRSGIFLSAFEISLVRNFKFFLLFIIGAWGLAAVPQALAGDADPYCPRGSAPYKGFITKWWGHDREEWNWFHFHFGHEGQGANGFGLVVYVQRGINEFERIPYDQHVVLFNDVQIQYVLGADETKVSEWLDAPFDHWLDADTDPVLRNLPNGVYALTFKVRGPGAWKLKPGPAFVHIDHDDGQPLNPTVPIQGDGRSVGGQYNLDPMGPGVKHVNLNERYWKGYPVNPNVMPWTTPTHQESRLQVEEFTGTVGDFELSVPMWWQSGNPDTQRPQLHNFVRAIASTHQGQDVRELRQAQERNPVKDGPRGVNWISGYVQGQVDWRGRAALAENSGRVVWVMPDGEVITLAGWVTDPGKDKDGKDAKDPVWMDKPLAAVRRNQVLRGDWVEGIREFHTPTDVTSDPWNPNVLYVTDFENNRIMMLEVSENPKGSPTRVSVFAGDPNGASGFADGRGHQARFRGPNSITFDEVHDCLWVADLQNHSIRKIDREGNVSTPFGGDPYINPAFDHGTNRNRFGIESPGWEQPVGFPFPFQVRMYSNGDVGLLSLGLGLIQRLNPVTGQVTYVTEVRQRFEEFVWGWASMDIDRWGTVGVKDAIYLVKLNSWGLADEEGLIYNQIYKYILPGDPRHYILPPSEALEMWGRFGPWGTCRLPHYAWASVIDPRGAVIFAGAGHQGLVRARLRKPGDIGPVSYEHQYEVVEQGKYLWRSGTPSGRPGPSCSLALKFGWGGNNYLGYPSVWGMRGFTDQQLVQALEIPQQDYSAGDLQKILAWIRYNMGTTLAFDPPQPPTIKLTPEVNALTMTVQFPENTEGVYVDLAKDAQFNDIVWWNADLSWMVGYTDILRIPYLEADTTYYFRLRTYLPDGQVSADSKVFSARTDKMDDTISPPAPEKLEATDIGDTGFTLNWVQGPDKGGSRLEGVWLDVSLEGDFSSYVWPYRWYTVAVDESTTNFALTGLAPNTTYYVRLGAWDSRLNYNYSETLTVTTK